MRRMKKINGLLLSLVLLLVFISVGYATLQTKLNINGTTQIKNNRWDVHFENVNVVDGNVTPTQDVSIISPTSITFRVPLVNQGDFYKFEVDVVNTGTIDAMVSVVSNGLTSAQKKYITYDVSYKNAVIPEIKIKDSLPAGAIRRLTVFVKYRDDVPVSNLPIKDQTLNLNFSIKYVQDDKTSNTFLLNASTLSGLSNQEDKSYNDSTSIYKSQMYTFSHPQTEQTPVLVDYRYIGSSPNNYIEFNNETWRIIGVFDGRIKIIREDDIGYVAWDSNNRNDWTISTLKTKLNSGDYWEKLTPQSKGYLDTATYYLGKVKDLSTGKDIYNYERGTDGYMSWNGFIGLMYSSDYVYTFANGVDNSCFDNPFNCGVSNFSNSWLYKNYHQWTISPIRGNNTSSLYASDCMRYGIANSTIIRVRPVAYLKSDIVLDGMGTSSNPYVIV